MLFKRFVFATFLQIIAAYFILIYVWDSNKIIFRHRIVGIDDPQSWLYYQVDSEAIDTVIFIGFPSAILFTVLSLAIILVFGTSNQYKNKYFIASLSFGCLEFLVCIYRLIEMIIFTQSLVACDTFVVEKSMGCYIP
jgi:hypothetical protein